MPSVSIARRAQIAVAVACVLAIGAMLRYPGGTALDVTTRGYSLSRNFLSDLGMTVAYNHEANRLGAALFVASLLLLVIGLGTAGATIGRFLAMDAASRPWARLAGIALVAACGAFVGVAVTPENRLMSLHVSFTNWAWRTVPAIGVFLGLASRIGGRVRSRAAFTWFGAALLLAGYAVSLNWGPSVVQQPGGLMVLVIAQKAAAVVLIAALLIAASEVDRASEASTLTAAGSDSGVRAG